MLVNALYLKRLMKTSNNLNTTTVLTRHRNRAMGCSYSCAGYTERSLWKIQLAAIQAIGYIITTMKYEIRIKKKVTHRLKKLPVNVQKLLFLLIADLQADGPVQKAWRIFSPLGKDRYHCHLNYRYVACWTCHKDEIVIEVYYVGTREKAPY